MGNPTINCNKVCKSLYRVWVTPWFLLGSVTDLGLPMGFLHCENNLITIPYYLEEIYKQYLWGLMEQIPRDSAGETTATLGTALLCMG